MGTPANHNPTNLVGEISHVREQVRVHCEQIVIAAALLAQDQSSRHRSSSQISSRLAAIRAHLLKY